CVWCDSPDAQAVRPGEFRVEREPGTGDFEALPNPVDVRGMVRIIDGLKTPDLHSISLTGGEPLSQVDFLEALCPDLDDAVYLETNGTLPEAAGRVAGFVDYASVDIKDETATPYSGWEDVVEREFRTIEVLKDAGAEVFAKVVVTDNTEPGNIAGFARRLSELGVPLAIQPVTGDDGTVKVSQKRLFLLSEAAAQYLSAEDLTISLQTHKFQGLL
ncbi:MAG: 7-carboxy-7-deazaguanine synthase, partial [Methanobacteriota archaeon]